MRTQIVYVVVSGTESIYAEQAWASAWSLRQHTPNAHITLCCDEDTVKFIRQALPQMLNVIDELKSVAIDGSYTAMQRSRWLKTNLRRLIEGDFLFIDTDTLVTADLSGIDDMSCSIGAVADLHKPLSEGGFNSGVLYVKDDAAAHHLFELWHTQWKENATHGINFDQPALWAVCDALGEGCITELGGEWNVQIELNINYLSSAKIVHFFRKFRFESSHPFFNKEIYHQIRRDGGISDTTAHAILHCRQLFADRSVLIEGDDLFFMMDRPAAKLFFLFRKHRKIYNLLSKILK